jgi:hypothetical protein
MRLQEQDVLDRKFALRIVTMIESRLIWYKHYYGWADEIIMAMERPPYWILEIATVKYFPQAAAIVREFVYSEPFETFDYEEYTDEYIACLFLRYRHGAISWATFLNEAGAFTDAHNGERYCEDFYDNLNILEDNEYSKKIEQSQREEIETEFATAISTINTFYLGFLEYFRRYVANKT